MARYIIVRDSDGSIVNATDWDGETPFALPGHTLVEHATAAIGGTYLDGAYTAPAEPPAEPPDNYKPMIRRRADKLMRAGDVAGALLILKTIGE